MCARFDILMTGLVLTRALTSMAVAQESRGPSLPSLVVSPVDGIIATGPPGGPFSPSAFEYRISATTGTINFSVHTPLWLTANVRSGTIDPTGVTVIFTINPTAARLRPGHYASSAVGFLNVTNGRGSSARMARLSVSAKPESTQQDKGRLLDDKREPLLNHRREPLLAR